VDAATIVDVNKNVKTGIAEEKLFENALSVF
jgi:hypothetical protein